MADDRPEETGAADAAETPTAGPAPPRAGLADYAPPPPPPPPRRRTGRVVGLVVGVIAVLGGAVFAAVALTGDEGSPEGAVRDLFEAIEREDVLGILEALPPSERDALRRPVVDLADELKRLEIFSGNLDLSRIRGLDLTFENVELSSKTLADGIAAVDVTRGTVRTRVNPAELPLGDFVRDIVGQADEPSTESESIAEDSPTFITVKEDGDWRVSIWYSFAENARNDAGLPVPPFGRGIRAVGAPTPEQVIEEMFQAASDLDLRGFFELLPPDEARALHDYAPLFLDDVEQGAQRARQLVKITVDGLDLSSQQSGDTSRVKVDRLARVAVAATDEDTGQTANVFTYENGCVTTAGFGFSAEPQRLCQDQLLAGGFTFPFFGALGQPPKIDVGRPDLAFTVVRRNGRWFLSPTRSVLDSLVQVVRVFDRADLDAFREWFENLGRGFEETSGSAESVPPPPPPQG